MNTTSETGLSAQIIRQIKGYPQVIRQIKGYPQIKDL